MSVHTFQLPHRAARRRSHSRDNKRKRESYDEDEDADAPDPDRGQTPSSGGITSLSASQAEQYRVAGLDPSESVPAGPFPHSPTVIPPRLRGLLKPRGVLEQQAASPKSRSLRQQHLGVLMSVMHRCLLDSDYERAGRAWSLLLRSDPPLDIRETDRWGIGAEILMRRAGPASRQSAGVSRTDDSDIDSSDERERRSDYKRTAYHEAGVTAARQYYERLIVQYPNLPAASHQPLPRAATFYPALFSVWLFQVSMARDKALRQSEQQMSTGDSPARSFEDEPGPSEEERQAMLEDLRTRELREAHLIDSRLRELLSVPPYDRDEHLRELHRMIKLWARDLEHGSDEHESASLSDGAQ